MRSRALALGFDLVGVVPALPVPHVERYRDWLANSYHGEMGYMARPDRIERREDPGAILPDARSIICVGLNYYPGALPENLAHDPSRGLVSAYAWGLDYHDLMLPRLEDLAAFICTETGDSATTHAGCPFHCALWRTLTRGFRLTFTQAAWIKRCRQWLLPAFVIPPR